MSTRRKRSDPGHAHRPKGRSRGLQPRSILGIIAGLLALGYIVWAVRFMLESSVVAIDGHRYFGLFDDAMISMRYAWNFSHGHGLMWNPGERIEGYTNLLWTLVMAIPTALLNKSDALLAMQIAGIAIVLGACVLMWKLADRVTAGMVEPERLAIRLAAVLMTLTYFPLSYWSLTGMETGLLTLLVIAALWVLEEYEKDRPGASLQLALLLGLAYLTREDAVILAIPILIYAGAAAARGRNGIRGLLPAIGIFLVFPIGREIFRLVYYGDVLPNTYYLKLTGMPLPVRLENGLGFTSLYLFTHIILLGIGLAGCALKPDRRKLLYLTLAVLPILYQIWTGGDPVRIWRMMTPALPAAVMLFCLGALELIHRTRAATFGAVQARLLGYMTALAILSVNLIFTPYILFREPWFPLDFYRVRTNAAVALDEVTTEDATVAVLAAGVVPYYTGRRAHDMLGRTDAYIAALPADLSGATGWGGMSSVPGHNKYDLEYSIKQLRPTYVESSQWGRQDITEWMSMRYVRVNYKGVELWLLKGSPAVKWELLPDYQE